MRMSDIKLGMRLVAVGNYADCIKTGDEYKVYLIGGELTIACRGASGIVKARCHHSIQEEFADENEEIPELVELKS